MAYHDSEEPLRLHIRKLLLQYSITHLTTDYVQFTQDAVSDVRRENWFCPGRLVN